MASVVSAIRNTIPITLFNRGLAGKIFEEVKKTGTKLVMKNNQPEVVLMSPEEYLRMQDELEDLRLGMMAVQRMQNYDPTMLISQAEIDREFGFTEDDLAGSDEVELE